MQKYHRLFIQNINELLAYRLRTFLIVATQFLPPLAMIFVFTSIGSQKISLNQNQLISYYIFTCILYLFLSSKIEDYVKLAIQEGELASILLKPIKFINVALVKDLSARIFKLTLGLPLFTLLIFINRSIINTEFLPSFFIIIPMIIISFLLSFILSFVVGLLTFWVEEVWGFQNVKEVSVILLGGTALPYQVFPDWSQKILVWTPFPYLGLWPLHSGFSGSLITEFVIALVWLVFFIFILRLMWRKGLQKYNTLGVA